MTGSFLETQEQRLPGDRRERKSKIAKKLSNHVVLVKK
jgi:hypothetical protein